MTHLKIELNKQTCQALISLFDGVFRTGAAITIVVDFDSLLHYPPEDPGFPGGGKEAPTVVVQPDKMTIEIK